MIVYHVYECSDYGKWIFTPETARVFKNKEDAIKYGNSLVNDAVYNQGEDIDYEDGNYEFSEKCSIVSLEDYSHLIQIDEYELY